MNSIQIEIIGLLAASFTTFAFVPQVFKIWKNKNAKGVSVSMYVINCEMLLNDATISSKKSSTFAADS